MPFTLQHTLVSEALYPETLNNGPSVSFRVSAQGRFQVLYPGRLQRHIEATVRHSMRIDTPDTQPPAPPGGIDTPGHPTPPHPVGPPRPLHNGVEVTVEAIPLDVRLYDPNGQLFTRDDVTLADLKKYRDLRGSPRGDWSYTISGQSRTYTPLEATNEAVTDPRGVIDLSVLETVPSTSAAPLIPRTQLLLPVQRFTFDLNRVGQFVANVVSSGPFGLAFTGHLGIRLLDPDGVQVAASTSRTMRCPIALSHLGKSRDAAGHPRLWTLEVTQDRLPGALGAPSVTATVLGEGRIRTAVLQDRIQKLFGPGGSFIKLVGENRSSGAAAVLTITDVAAAETIDMHGLLDSRLRAEGQSVDIQANVPMVLYHVDPLDYGLSLDVSEAKLTSIDVSLAPGQGLGATTPAFRLVIKMAGDVNLKWHGLTVADARLSNGSLAIEVGVRIDPDGTPRIVQWVPEEAFDIDFSAATIAAMLIALTPIIGGISAGVIHHYIEELVNTRFSKAVAKLFDDPSLGPRIMMTLFGTHLTYLPPRFEGSDILFEHIAPLEPDLQPRADYSGVIGRTVMREAIGHPTFMPMSLGDTWAANNLKSKIDHIVVVMMENRSYDHVLGYRALAPTSDGRDGLTNELMAAVAGSLSTATSQPAVLTDGGDQVGIVHPLRRSGFALNAVKLRTRLPKGVGHELDDVKQQLTGQIDGPGGRRINDPHGFVDNFRDKKLGGNPQGADGVVPFDVLGYYESNANVVDPNTGHPVDDLPIYSFLAEHFTYSDRYFCSHPGPTLPNRMFSLTGDVQHDRLGAPILDNNHGDNFLLSRATTVYDILSRNGVSWRVYESNPSVTMLRMFARYATDDVNIRPLDELARDAAAGNLPALTVVEPAMHHHPEDDDHPDADMYRGQMFIRRVYEALRSNAAAWQKTLLLITYDEHGGFYDHVVPPLADILTPPRPDVVAGDLVASDPTTVTGPRGAVSVGGTLQPTATPGGVGHGHLSPEALGVLLGAHEGFAVATPTDPTIEIPYGVRVPTFVISPWVTPGQAPAITLDHCSILKTILARFCSEKKPFLSDRVRASQSFEAFLSAPAPRMDGGIPPSLSPLPVDARRMVSGSSAIITAPLFRKRLREEQVDFHEVSGRLARMLGR